MAGKPKVLVTRGDHDPGTKLPIKIFREIVHMIVLFYHPQVQLQDWLNFVKLKFWCCSFPKFSWRN